MMCMCVQCTLQQYVDDVFETILHIDCSLPAAVKYLFDFLDNAAVQHGITDPEVTHMWKSNRLSFCNNILMTLGCFRVKTELCTLALLIRPVTLSSSKASSEYVDYLQYILCFNVYGRILNGYFKYV